MSELVIFDLDNTLIKEQTQALLLSYIFRKRLVSLYFYSKVMFWFILYKLGLVRNPEKIMEYAFSFLEGVEEKEFRNVIDVFFREKLHNYIFKKAQRLIKEHKNKRRKILIISNAVEYIPEKISRFLEVDYYIGTRLEKKNNKFTGKIDGGMIYGKNKVIVMKKFIKKNNLSLKGSWGYSDHYSDISLLEMTTNPVAVNPDKKMKKKAIKEGWSILIFKETII